MSQKTLLCMQRSSLTLNLLDGNEVATGAKLTMQQTANDVDDVKRS